MLIGGAALESPAAPLGDLLRLGLAAKPEEVALLSNRRSLTWRELEEASSRLAAGYKGLGLAPGDRVASLMPNRVDLVVHYIACFKAELIATPLNYRYTSAEIDHALSVSGARVLLAHVERAEDIEASALAGGDVAGPLLVGEQGAGAADLQRVVDLGRGVAVVQRRRDQLRLEAGEVVDDEVDAVRHQRGDPVSRRQAEAEVPGRQA